MTVLRQATLQYPVNNGAFLNGGLSIDKRQNLIVSGSVDCGGPNCGLSGDLSFVLPVNATSTTSPLYSLAPFYDPGSTDAVAYAKDADRVFTLAKNGTLLFDQQNAANAPILRQTTVSNSSVWVALAVDATGQYAFLAGYRPNKILPLVGNASTFVPGAPISGSNTGLNFPLTLTVGPP